MNSPQPPFRRRFSYAFSTMRSSAAATAGVSPGGSAGTATCKAAVPFASAGPPAYARESDSGGPEQAFCICSVTLRTRLPGLGEHPVAGEIA